MIKLTLSLAIIFLLGCSDKNTPSGPQETSSGGNTTIQIQIGKVGALAKVAEIAEIELQTLFITLAAPDEDTILDTIAVNGNGQVLVNKVYSNLASLKTWTVSAYSIDTTGVIIHNGGTSFIVPVDSNVDVSLDLSALYSMVEANFSPVRDSVTRFELLIDTLSVAQQTIAKQSNIGGAQQLTYDYLAAGENHHITMNVFGDMWGRDTLLYTADTTIYVIAGLDTAYDITLNWVGPNDPNPGQATMQVTLGTIGTVILNGTLTNQAGDCGSYNPVNEFCDARDGSVYTFTTIGTQTWMAENLNYSGNDGAGNKINTTGYCYNQPDHSANANCAIYGRLYSWPTMMQGASSSSTSPSGIQGICPDGWSVPSELDWGTLYVEVGGQAIAGLRLKANSPNWAQTPGTDNYGFTVLPAGYAADITYAGLGVNSDFWSTTEHSSDRYWYINFSGSSDNVASFLRSGVHKHSVRCIRDI